MLIFLISFTMIILGIILLKLNKKRRNPGLEGVGVFSLIIGLSFSFSFMMITAGNINPSSELEKELLKYESIKHKTECPYYLNEDGTIPDHILKEAEDWNEKIKNGRKSSDNIWVGCLVPDIYYDLELIEISQAEKESYQ